MKTTSQLSWPTQTAIYVIAGLLVEFAMRSLFSGSEAVQAHAAISVWWCGVVVAYALSVSLRSALALVPMLALVDYVALVFGLRSYHDLPDGSGLVLLNVMRAALFVTPIVVAMALKEILVRLRLV